MICRVRIDRDRMDNLKHDIYITSKHTTPCQYYSTVLDIQTIYLNINHRNLVDYITVCGLLTITYP